jgi:peptide deformylase
MVNPVLEKGRGKDGIVEGCLSVPEVWGQVPRWASVSVRGYDPSGRPIQVSAKGLLAIILQHELDHLDGRLFIDRLTRDRAGTIRAGEEVPPRHGGAA